MIEMTKKQLMKELKVTERTVFRWLEKGCPCKKEWEGLRPILKFNLLEVQEWLKNERLKL